MAVCLRLNGVSSLSYYKWVDLFDLFEQDRLKASAFIERALPEFHISFCNFQAINEIAFLVDSV